MISEVVRCARDHWRDWLGEAPPRSIRFSCAKGGPAHAGRGMILLFDGESSHPRIVMKVAFSERERGFLEAEYENLAGLHPVAAPELRAGIPEPLSWLEVGGAGVMATGFVPGRRVLHPVLRTRGSFLARRTLHAFYERTFEWSRSLSQVSSEPANENGATLSRIAVLFGERFAPDGNAKELVQGFAEAVEGESIRWAPSWQHGATDITNALVRRGSIRFVDWEHASSRATPWFDIAYAPLSAARLARRQQSGHPVVDIFEETLDNRSWVGGMLQETMEEHWAFPLSIPTAVVLTAMECSLRRVRPGRPFPADLALQLLETECPVALRWLAPNR